MTEGGEVACWGRTDAAPPPGRYTSVSVAHDGHKCALTVTGEVVCWGNPYGGQTNPPRGRYTAVSVGFFASHGFTGNSCALDSDGRITCWGLARPGPEGRYTAVSAGGFYNCALTEAGRVSCESLPDAPAGSTPP